jgi:glucose/arabinose dehydrogenase
VAALSAQDNPTRIRLHRWANNVESPVALANMGDDRLFVVEQPGRIRIVSDSMQVVARPFLDIVDSVNSTGGEQGLLGMAFDPNYTTNGFFYVYYIFGSGAGESRISRFHVSADPDSADQASEQVIYTWPQPYSNHNGGCIQFGQDGFLYIGFGDGGSGNDPEGHGQDLSDPLGDMIRLDVSDPDTTYMVPPTNPFVNTVDTLPEIWASGLRNPWRFSFDRETGDLWIGDVGQGAWEEVDTWPNHNDSGPNFGWRCREGFVATPGVNQTGCLGPQGYVAPVRAFSHTPQDWCAISGGYVYRGGRYPHLTGRYIVADYCAGDFVGLSAPNYTIDTLYMTENFGYSGFGEDRHGELYVLNVNNNTVDKIYDACPMDAPVISFDGEMLSTGEGLTYQWYRDGLVVPGATTQTWVPTVNGAYTVVVNYGAPCTLVSAETLVLTVGIDEQHASNVTVFPVPASTQLVIEGAHTGAWTADLFDATGRKTASANWATGTQRLLWDVSAVANGLFMLQLRDAQGRVQDTRRVTITH